MISWPCKLYEVMVLFPANASRPEKDFALAESACALLEDNVELHAFENTPNAETPYWYNAADVVVLPSFYEGSANAVKEAMACNRPLVTTDMGDCRERIEGVAGCYVANSYNVAEFTELLMRALEYIKKTRGRERLMKDEISASQIARKLTDIYENVNK